MTIEYTAEITRDIVSRYTDALEAGADYEARAELIREIAGELTSDEVEVTEQSVRGKLVAEKVYVGKEKAKSEKAGSYTKEDFVKALRTVTGLELKSIDKATKADIQGLFEYITQASARAEADAS